MFVPESEETAPSEAKKADAFAELVQCLDDRSLSFVIREASDDGPEALKILRQHCQGKEKPCVISLYTELTTLKMSDNESIVNYMIRAEMAATALKNADKVVSDLLLIAMVLKGLLSNFKTFSAIVIQHDKQMTLAEFKVALRNHKESEKEKKTKENVMALRKCGKKGYRKSECWSKSVRNGKWCSIYKTKTHKTKDCRNNTGKRDSTKKAEHRREEKNDKGEHTFMFKVNDNCDCDNECHVSDNCLLVDSGATSHIVSDKSKFINFDKNFNPDMHYYKGCSRKRCGESKAL